MAVICTRKSINFLRRVKIVAVGGSYRTSVVWYLSIDFDYFKLDFISSQKLTVLHNNSLWCKHSYFALFG